MLTIMRVFLGWRLGLRRGRRGFGQWPAQRSRRRRRGRRSLSLLSERRLAVLVDVIGHQIRRDRQDQEDPEDDAGRPGEHVTGLGAKRGVTTTAPERAGQSSAATFLDQHQQDQKNADDEQDDDEKVEKKTHYFAP